jgi:hypothetical protein
VCTYSCITYIFLRFSLVFCLFMLPEVALTAAPSLEDIEKAHHDLKDLLRPLQRDKSQQYKDPGFDKRTTKCLEAMKLYCFNIIDMESKKQPGETGIWTKASVQTSKSLGFGKKGSVKPGTHHAQQLQEWVQTFIDD